MQTSQRTVSMTLTTVTDLQDTLLNAMNDLDRLGGLLDHATENLMDRFSAANMALAHLKPLDPAELSPVREALQLAVTELQFHDMASQLLIHMDKLLKTCAVQLTEGAVEIDVPQAPWIHGLPLKGNPVMQTEMGAGPIELF